MNDEDFKLPEMPNNKLVEYNSKEGEIENTDELLADGNYLSPVAEDFENYSLDKLQTRAAVGELSDCDMYLKNLHTGFKYVNSINSLLKVVGGCISVHKHKREVLNELKLSKPSGTVGGVEIDDQGNVIVRKV